MLLRMTFPQPVIVSLAVIVSFLMIASIGTSGLHTDHAGVYGVFLSLCVTILLTKLFIGLHKVLYSLHKNNLTGVNWILPQALFSILPFCLTVGVASLVRLILSTLGITDFNQLIIDLTMLLFNSIENSFLSAIPFFLYP